eukprot:Nk52_evm22s1360 gene=Nk52_evmTU22s1360
MLFGLSKTIYSCSIICNHKLLSSLSLATGTRSIRIGFPSTDRVFSGTGLSEKNSLLRIGNRRVHSSSIVRQRTEGSASVSSRDSAISPSSSVSQSNGIYPHQNRKIQNYLRKIKARRNSSSNSLSNRSSSLLKSKEPLTEGGLISNKTKKMESGQGVKKDVKDACCSGSDNCNVVDKIMDPQQLEKPSFHRRKLPQPPAVEFSSSKGKEMFANAFKSGHADSFFSLIQQFRTQDEPAFCGLAALSMCLNTLNIDPGRTWKGVWRWFDERMLDCCEPIDKVEKVGITFSKVACLARCNGANAIEKPGDQISFEEFKTDIIQCSQSVGTVLLLSYSRKTFMQTGDGHFSPSGAYDPETNMVLILDVARFKYPPHWVPLELLYKSIQTIDPDSGKCRGYMLLSKHPEDNSLFFTMAQRSVDMRTMFTQLQELPSISQKCERIPKLNNVDEAMRCILGSMPKDMHGIITTYAAEFPSATNANSAPEEYTKSVEILTNQIRELDMFSKVENAVKQVDFARLGLSMEGASQDNLSQLYCMLFLALPTYIWNKYPDCVKSKMVNLACVSNLPPLLKHEVAHLRNQMTHVLNAQEGIFQNTNKKL